jgi:two-component system, sensor histidine kinase PdtaS
VAADDVSAALRRSAALPTGWPTGVKLLLILSAALLPLAMIGVLATLQTTRLASVETRARLRVAAAESSRALAIELNGDMRALRAALAALDRDPADAPSCARVQGVFAQQGPAGARFGIVGADGRRLCGADLPAAFSPAEMAEGDPYAARVAGDRLVLGVSAGRGRGSAIATFPAPLLATLARPSGFDQVATTLVGDDGGRLVLETLEEAGGLDRRETRVTPLGLAGLELEMQSRSPPITSSFLVALLLPIVMWALAAGIGWFVVDRLLIRPLRELRSTVAAFVPGDVIEPGDLSALPAQEIRELGDTFRAISRTVALHEAGLAEGLVRQTKLTREVHHRVKNNLQVISSLINIHARGARGEQATDAYASIGRRVDALAVVHRNHFAEAEETRGLNLRSVLGELASNLRASVPAEGGRQLGIVLDVEPLLVSQDVAVAIAFLVTELVELATACVAAAQVRIAVRAEAGRDSRAVLRLVSPAFAQCEADPALAQRYGRVIDGLARQLRAPMHREPLIGSYEVAIAITGRA